MSEQGKTAGDRSQANEGALSERQLEKVAGGALEGGEGFDFVQVNGSNGPLDPATRLR